MSVVVFKLKHIPSGLFALSADSVYTENSMTKLSVDGKLYTRKPKSPDASFQVIYPRTFDDTGFSGDTTPNNWQIVAYELKEVS